jgi:hypothetical protein
MKRVMRELYGAGILFFYYFKWPMTIGYPVLIEYLSYPRYWVMDILWIYSIILIVKDFIFKFVLKRSHCDSASCNSKVRENSGEAGEEK